MSLSETSEDWWPPGLLRPPTEDELPYDDGEPMESELHVRGMTLLITTLEGHWADRDDFYVGGNMFLYYNVLQAKKNDFRGPDVFLALGVERRVRKSWVIWQEGHAPDLVIELLSESTEAVDRGEKMRVYGGAVHVPQYVLFDPVSGALEFYLLEGSRYRRLAPNTAGRYPVIGTDLELGVWHGSVGAAESDWLRWFTVNGQVLPTGDERAAAERAGREAAERRVAELEALLAAQAGEPT